MQSTIGNNYRASPQTWEEEFFLKLRKLFVEDSGAIPENVWEMIEGNEEARNIWIDSFTHYSINYERNYEVRELFGDSLLNSALIYLFLGNPQDERLGAILRSPNPTDLMTQIKKNAVSKPFLRQMFYEKMDNLHLYIRCRPEFVRKTDIMEDVFESMISSIQLSVDRVVWEGKFMGPGFAAVTKFVHWFYTKRLTSAEFDLSGKKDIKSFMKEFLEKFYRYTTGKTTTSYDEDTETRTYVIRLAPHIPGRAINPFSFTKGKQYFLDPQYKTISVEVEASTGIINLILQTERSTTIKDEEPSMYTHLYTWFSRSREHSRGLGVFERYLETGETTYEIIGNLIPSQNDYEKLRLIAKAEGLDENNVDLKRTEFKNGDVTLVIWSRNKVSREKSILFDSLVTREKGVNPNMKVIETIRNWIISYKL